MTFKDLKDVDIHDDSVCLLIDSLIASVGNC